MAICPGSFDPVTIGHLDIITRASKLFDRVLVVVSVNSSKRPKFTAQERVELIRRCVTHLSNVQVETFDGLLADYARQKGATAIVKGLRAVSDFEYEFQMALINKKLYPQAETVFLTTSAENMYLSSSVVKDIASYGGDISSLVPACILPDIRRRFACWEGRNENGKQCGSDPQ